MVPWSAKQKWKAGWRGAGTSSQQEVFREYWKHILSTLGEYVDASSLAVPRNLQPPRQLPFAIDSPLFVCAPMVLQSERAFRMVVRSHAVSLCYSPMIVAKAMVEGGPEACPYTSELLRLCPEDRPIVAQLAGNDPQVLLAAAKIVEGAVDAIDLNLGCPQACARLAGYGAYLAAEHPQAAIEIVRVIAQSCSVPIFCKIRLSSCVEATIEFARELEAAGCSLLTVHARHMRQRDHQEPADLEAIRAVRAAVSIPVLSNGNCRTRADAEACVHFTGCDGIMSAVGLLRDPRLFDGPPSTHGHGHPKGGGGNGGGVQLMLTDSGTLADPAQALSRAAEYLLFASRYMVPEPRCLRDHLQAMLQGVLQFRLVEHWDLLGNDRLYTLPQFVELVRIIAWRLGHYSAVIPYIQDIPGFAQCALLPVRTLQEVKRMNSLDASRDDDCWSLPAGGSLDGGRIEGGEDMDMLGGLFD